MASEAQRLIGLSLTKIAQSRMNRGGISLHKNLLVATVLQKARFIFMEEAYAASYAGEPAPLAFRSHEHPAAAHESRQRQDGRAAKRRRSAESELEPEPVAAPAPHKRRCGDEQAGPEPAEDSPEPMEVDRITSLVSVFSFGASPEPAAAPRLPRSVSTPDLCSAQAKELDGLQRRTAVAMAV